MGSMKQKRRKKLAKAWIDFQQQHGLSDELRGQARSLGQPPKLLQERLASTDFDTSMSIANRIRQLYRQRQEERLHHATANESGKIEVKPKKPNKKPTLDPQWVKAKKVCQLNMADIRMAKELGMSPNSLMKNVPNSGQPWKTPVKIWIRDLYEKRQQQSSKKSTSRLDSQSTDASSTKQLHDKNSHELVIEECRVKYKEEDAISPTEG